MPHVIVKMYPGNSEEQKGKLAEEITKVIMAGTGKSEAAVSVSIVEVPEEVWMEQVYQTEILPKIENLYKKPGY